MLGLEGQVLHGLPNSFLIVVALLMAIWLVCELLRTRMLGEIDALVRKMPAPYNDIAKWFLMFDVTQLPDANKADGSIILELMRDREAVNVGRFFASIAVFLGLVLHRPILRWIGF
jgi:hypothetical protein